MQIKPFNNNTPRRLAEIIASGQPELITFEQDKRPYARVLSVDLYDELVEAAGERGKEILDRHREAAEQRKQEEAA